MDDSDALLKLLDAASMPGRKSRAPNTATGSVRAVAPQRQVQAQACKHYVEVLTGIKCKLPKVSGVLFKEQVSQLQYVPLDKAKTHAGESPWLTIGVLVKSEMASASNGQPFSRWQLSDLRGGELRLVLFGEAHGAHKLTAEGTVVALGSCRVSRDGQYTSASVSSEHHVQLLATSAGYGTCEGITKEGRRCQRAVDKTVSPYCEWHALQQQKQLRRDMRTAASAPAAAAALAGGTGLASGGGTQQRTHAAAGSFPAIGSTSGGSSCAFGGSGSGAAGLDGILPPGQLHAPSPGAALPQEQQQQQQGQDKMAQLMSNRARLAQQIRERGGLPAPDLNRTRPPSPRKTGMSSSGGSGPGSSGRDGVVGDGGANGRLQRPGAGTGRGTGSAGPSSSGSSAAKAGAAKKAKLLSGLGLAARPGGATEPPLGRVLGTTQAGRASNSGRATTGAEGARAAAAKAPQKTAVKAPPALRAAPGSAASQFAAAFGGVLQSAAPAEPEESAKMKTLAEAQRHQDIDRLLAHYEKKDAVAQQLEGITKMTVTAFRCHTCSAITEKRHPACSSHDVVRVQATKRWWSCRSCGWRLTTLNAVIPTKRCPKCRDPTTEFNPATAFVAPKEDRSNDAALHAGFATREGFLARGVEHDFALSSFR